MGWILLRRRDGEGFGDFGRWSGNSSNCAPTAGVVLIWWEEYLIIKSGMKVVRKEVNKMTRLREQAIEMIKEIPEDKIIYVWNILKNVKDLSVKPVQNDDMTEKAQALQSLRKFRGRLPETFDYKKELDKAREEKYADFN